LKMLEDNKITAEQAVELLKQVPDSDSGARYAREDRGRSNDQYSPDLGWIDDLRAVIEDTAANIGSAVRDAINANEYGLSPRHERFTAMPNANAGIREIVFEGKNAPIKMEAYSGDQLEVEVTYWPKGQWNPHFAFIEENGAYSLRYDDNALRALAISILAPGAFHIGSVSLQTRNAPVTAEGFTADRVGLYTKNAPVRVSGVTGERMNVESRNASVTIESVKSRDIEAQTSNAKITLEHVNAFSARLTTSNAKVEADASVITRLYAKSSNAAMQFENLSNNSQEPFRVIEAVTTNGKISVSLADDCPNCKLRASTTNGGIYCGLEGMVYQVNGKNYAEAQTMGYNEAGSKTDLNLQTSNGRISINR